MSRGLQERDKDGLLFEQRRYLDTLMRTASPAKAEKAAGRTSRTIKRWFTEPKFKQMYDEMFSNTNEELLTRLDSAAEKAMDVFIDALDADDGAQSVAYKCEQCGHEGYTSAPKVNWRTRMKAADVVLRIKKILVDRQEVEHGGTVTHLQLTASERLALARWQHGYQVPGALEQQFREYVSQGLIEPPKQNDDEHVVEGEARELPEEA